MSTSKIEQQVMASVATIYAVRKLFSATALKLYVCVLCLWGLGQLVWVARVFENLSTAGLQGFANFALSAVLNAETLVQLILLLGALVFVSLLLDLVRSTPSRRVFA